MVVSGCVTAAVPFRVTRTWFDTDWERQCPAVQVGGLDKQGWVHFVVTAGPVIGPGADVGVQNIWVEGSSVFMELRFIEPMAYERAFRRVARLEVEMPASRLPSSLEKITLVVGGVPVKIAVSDGDAVQLVRGRLAVGPLGVPTNELAALEPELVLLVRRDKNQDFSWRWYVELGPPGGGREGPRVHATIDAVSGEILELVVDK